ncbi:hypothetical protein [Atlantibacter hermannii]|uniref:hypothetical protein n=1 Tax=Atlantibacter hermannii TaxID=565 RepID=UPI00289CF099|nr:hypothetical protein [Atlantibacter hermannii]
MDDLYCNSDIQMKGFPILTMPFGQIPLRPVKTKKGLAVITQRISVYSYGNAAIPGVFPGVSTSPLTGKTDQGE